MSEAPTEITGEGATVWSMSRDVALVVASLLILAIFVWVIVQSLAFPEPFNEAEVGPGRVPMLAAVAGIVSCVMVLFFSVKHWVHGAGRTGMPAGRLQIRRPLAIVGASFLIIAWVEAMPRVGFYPASAVIVPLFMLLGGERRIWWLVLSSVGFVLAMYLCFALLLHIEFP